MTSAALAAAIRKVAPDTPIHVAISIAVNALGYGRAYDVPAELIVARTLKMGPKAGGDMALALKFVATEARDRGCQYARPVMLLAERLLAAAEVYKGPKYGAEG